jgi:hypothetical protein
LSKLAQVLKNSGLTNLRARFSSLTTSNREALAGVRGWAICGVLLYRRVHATSIIPETCEGT